MLTDKCYFGNFSPIKPKEMFPFALMRDDNKCQVCGSIATDVHFMNEQYPKLDYLFMYVSLCSNCHIKLYHSK